VQREILKQVVALYAIVCLCVGIGLVAYSEEQWQFVMRFGALELERVTVCPLRDAGIVVIVLGLGLALLALAVLSLDRTSGESNG
jgi:hypothetical protein